MTRDKQKAEAIKRMQLMGISPEAVKALDLSGTVHASSDPDGALTPVDTGTAELIRKFELEYGALVFLVVRSIQTYGCQLDSLIYVSQYEEDWELNMAYIKDGFVMTYKINYLYPEYSEFGSIAYEITETGVIRTA